MIEKAGKLILVEMSADLFKAQLFDISIRCHERNYAMRMDAPDAIDRKTAFPDMVEEAFANMKAMKLLIEIDSLFRGNITTFDAIDIIPKYLKGVFASHFLSDPMEIANWMVELELQVNKTN